MWLGRSLGVKVAQQPSAQPIPCTFLNRRYPLFLEGRAFVGRFHFKDTHTLVEHQLQEVPLDSLHLPPEPL